ncbi:hypothetical protein D3C72_1208100 [compost metagenome]
MQVDQAVAVDRRDADHTAGQNRPMWRLEAREFGQPLGQVTGASQGEELPGIAKNDPVETCHQTEQTDPYQHVHPGRIIADHGFHRLGQRIVDVRQLTPVADAAGHHHHADGQEHQGQNAADIGSGDRAFRVLGFLGGHGRAFDGEEEPDRKGDRRKNPGNRAHRELVRTRPAIEHEVAEAEARGDHAHEYQQLSDCQHGDHQLEGGRDADT